MFESDKTDILCQRMSKGLKSYIDAIGNILGQVYSDRVLKFALQGQWKIHHHKTDIRNLNISYERLERKYQ